jgi:LmbE family N-acetylglucosaminyl deacetylase
VTVFAGRPKISTALTEWDRSSGFIEGDDVVGARRLEDQAALRIVGASAIWLPYCDSQYRQNHPIWKISRTLRFVIQAIGPTIVLFPLGLFHSDHVLTSEACLRVIGEINGCTWITYEEALYRCISDLTFCRHQYFKALGLSLRIPDLAYYRNQVLKSAAMHCYRSQLRALNTMGRPGYFDALNQERYWVVAP